MTNGLVTAQCIAKSLMLMVVYSDAYSVAYSVIYSVVSDSITQAWDRVCSNSARLITSS